MLAPLISALMISAVTPGVSQSLSAALTTAGQVLNSPLFGDLSYFVTGKKDES